MRESVTKFDLEAAFKALDELDVPAAGKVKANKPALNEIFSRKSKFDALMEEYYDISNSNDLAEAKDERDAEIAKAKLARIEKIVDLDAKTPEDLLTSYVGKFIIQCPQCMTLFYKNPEDIEESEEDSTVVNVSEVCQHCGNESGYTLIGKVGEATEDEMENFDTSELAPEEATEESEADVLTVDVDGTDEETEDIENELNMDDEELDLNIEDDEEDKEEDKKEESFSNSNEKTLVEQLTEDSEVSTSAEDFEKLISSPEFKKPISDTAVRAMMDEFDENSKKPDDNLEEGIFDSKADKQKKYKELINQVFEKDYLVAANEVVVSASDLIEEIADSFNDDGSKSKTEALGIIKMIKAAKQTINKTPNSLVMSIRNLGQKYKSNSNNLDTLKNFLHKVGKLQTTTKDGYKAMEFLFEKINKDLDLRLNKTIEFIKREYHIVEELECESELTEAANNEVNTVDEETLTEAGLSTLAKTIGKKAKQAGQNLKNTVSDAIDKFADSAQTREEKADWILANARKNYKNVKLDNKGELVPDESNQKFKVFLVVGFEETYSNGKKITMPPSYNNKDLITGMEDPKAFKEYKAADDSAKGWSMQQGKGPAFIYLAKDAEDEEALFLCQYFEGKLANDQLEKYLEVIKKDIKGANIEAGSEDKNIAQKSSENTAKVETKATQASAIKNGMKVQLGDKSAEVSNVADAKGGKALTLTYADGSTQVIKVGNSATMMVIAEALEKDASDLATVMENLEELQESALESLISNSLIESYKNVAGFRLKDCNYLDEKFTVNGIIHFTSGKTRKTTYTFTEALENGDLVTLQGINEKLGHDKKFILVGRNQDKTFITESFKRI